VSRLLIDVDIDQDAQQNLVLVNYRISLEPIRFQKLRWRMRFSTLTEGMSRPSM
jgi:hypothetical protein